MYLLQWSGKYIYISEPSGVTDDSMGVEDSGNVVKETEKDSASAIADTSDSIVSQKNKESDPDVVVMDTTEHSGTDNTSKVGPNGWLCDIISYDYVEMLSTKPSVYFHDLNICIHIRVPLCNVKKGKHFIEVSLLCATIVVGLM